MKLLVDMTLPPTWQGVLESAGIEAVHWSQIGSPRAEDKEVFGWARLHEWAVLTHDLDSGLILSHIERAGTTVILLQSVDIAPGKLCPVIVRVLEMHEKAISAGALVSVDAGRGRVRILPLRARNL